MSSSPLRLKNTRNWFAAGVEVQQALEILTDGAFKVFMHLCLNAERKTGISRNSFSNSPSVRGSVQISPPYWPYGGEAECKKDEAVDRFVSEVKNMLQERACIGSSFSSADRF